MRSRTDGQLQEIADRLIREIEDVAANREIVVAFSGGEDSCLAAHLCKLAVGSERVVLATVDWGQFTYQTIKKNVGKLAIDLGLKHVCLDGTELQRAVWKHGPNCNGCTKSAKLRTVQNNFPDRLIVTGSNQSDSWGKFGLKVFENFYSPLKDLTKPQIKRLINFFQIEPVKIGESSVREGCKLKHLMKMLINPDYHGRAVAESNELLLEFLYSKGKKVELANVKIIGPLSKNVALVNVYPHLSDDEKEEILSILRSLNTVDEAHVLDRPVKLKVLVNPCLYNDPSALDDIFVGFIKRDFAVPVSVTWIKARNNRLRTFQVVDFEYE